jgi:hypothetical protein
MRSHANSPEALLSSLADLLLPVPDPDPEASEPILSSLTEVEALKAPLDRLILVPLLFHSTLL